MKVIRTLLPVLMLTCLSTQTYAMTPEDFSACVKDLGVKAKAAGISDKTISDALNKAEFNPDIITLDRKQPEFSTTFTDYLNRRITPKKVEQGRELLAKHKTLLNEISKKYGVSPPYLLAFWGLETNYGSYFGKLSVVNSLATLACDERRSEFFTGELIAALRILDEGAIKPDNMVGSWAGAMGHVQFMPSAFLKHAIDFDGDSKRDLWNSLPDALGSAGNFLNSLGWQTGDRWGREVILPKDFPFLEAGLSNQKKLTEWSKLGIKKVDNTPLPHADMMAALLVPVGHKGPAFLVYDNFNVIMRWNRSEFYALSVGYLADRIAGAGQLNNPPPEGIQGLHRDQIFKIQEQLAAKGFSSGEPDGILGPATRRSLGQFQHQQGMIADGFPDQQTLNMLEKAPENIPEQAPEQAPEKVVQ